MSRSDITSSRIASSSVTHRRELTPQEQLTVSNVAIRLGLSGITGELAAGPMADDEVLQLGEQHGARIGRLGLGVNVQNR